MLRVELATLGLVDRAPGRLVRVAPMDSTTVSNTRTELVCSDTSSHGFN